MKICYLHGLLSSPKSTKAKELESYFSKKQDSVNVVVPDLYPTQKDFESMLLSSMIDTLHKELPTDIDLIVGSSHGGLIAIHLLDSYPKLCDRLVLLAPSLYFFEFLKKRNLSEDTKFSKQGYMPINYERFGGEVKFPWDYVEDLKSYQKPPQKLKQTTLLIHGTSDNSIPVSESIRYYQKSWDTSPISAYFIQGGNHRLSNVGNKVYDTINGWYFEEDLS